ncbi:hypothetical protein [Sphingopyxis terrae]|uniref:Stress response protein n=1 Tax=Sphingopyxis terrae subsp. ummariensis TaxID=429001 RepID=A0A1Y6FMZ1_9SPHN|nr:hypothetical protein [Sphingopyxis terrae]SMQ76384.1 hypothetical protein SAMN06295984_1825 [Sphingopyxis terrae subsp. ummariensis]
MTELPDMCCKGEAARLFPVLSENSKEGRTLSIFLACLENVSPFGRALLGGLGVKVGARGRIDTFTEVEFKKSPGDKNNRPDGLIIVKTGKNVWTALVEAKVGNANLTNDQIESYLTLAKANNIDAVITLSNQFTPLPTHHPLSISAQLTRKVDLFHWSWGHVITQAQLLRDQEEVEDREQLILLNELQRFLLHSSSGVKEFDQLSPAWSDLCSAVAAGSRIGVRDPKCQEVVGGWHQALDRMTSMLSRQIGEHVKVAMAAGETHDPVKRLKGALADLSGASCLKSDINIPDAAAKVQISADLQKRVLTFQMRLRAPGDRQSTKARLRWLLNQLGDADPNELHIRLAWPGSSPATQYTLAALREDPTLASSDRPEMAPHAFDVLLVRELGARFAQPRNFVTELLNAATHFYNNVAFYLVAWQARPGKIAGEKREPASVSTEGLRDQVEQEALQRTG